MTELDLIMTIKAISSAVVLGVFLFVGVSMIKHSNEIDKILEEMEELNKKP